MADFPTYGELLLDGYGETPEGAVNRTEMESGPAKQAKVRSKELVRRNITYRFTASEYVAWKTWRNDIARGASWFNWTNPLTGTVVVARIERGVYNAVANNPGDGALTWDVGFVLETYE